MENIEQLSDFLKNCCRVCLSVENEMVESSNIVENFNKSIDELLYECANFKVRFCFFTIPKITTEKNVSNMSNFNIDDNR